MELDMKNILDLFTFAAEWAAAEYAVWMAESIGWSDGSIM